MLDFMRASILLIFCALAGLAAWLVLGAGPSTTTASNASAAEIKNERTGADEPLLATEVTEPDRTTVQRVSVLDAPEDSDLPSLAAGEGVRIEVSCSPVGGGPPAPVPGARVWVLDTGRTSETLLIERIAAGGDIATALRETGTPYRTGADGVLVVPSPRKELVLASSAPGLSGFAMPAARETDGVIRLHLHALRPLAVRVIGPDERPISGIPVAVRVGGTDLLRVETRADGTARLEDLSILLDLGLRNDMSVGVGALLAEPVEVPLNLDQLPVSPLVLRVPALGSVRATVQTNASRTADAPEQALLMEAGFAGDRAISAQVIGADFTDEAAELQYVGLGLSLNCEAQRARDRRTWSAHFSGPTSAGEVVHVQLEPEASPTVRLRVLDPSGNPLRDARLQLTFEGSVQRLPGTPGVTVATDAEGDLYVALSDPPGIGKRSALKLLRPAGEDSQGVSLHGAVQVSGPMAAGENDLGSVQLLEAPLVAAGVVLDRDGAPIAGVMVRPEAQRVSSRGSISWRPQMRMATRTDEEGRFKIHGKVPAGTWRLRAEASGRAGTTQEFPLGAAGLVLVMARGALLEAQVLVDEGIPVKKLYAHLAIERPDGSEAWESGQPDAVGKFSWDELPDGRATLSITAEQGEILATIEGLNLTPGEAVMDVRCQPIDLRGRLKAFRLEFHDAAGERVKRVRMTSAGEDSVDWQAYYGTLDVITARAPLDLHTSVPGYRGQVLSGVTSSMTVTLERGPAVTVRLENPDLVPDGATLIGWFGAEKPAGESTLNADGVIRLWVDAPGSHLLRLGLRRGRSVSPISQEVVVEVQKGKAETIHPVNLDVGAVAAAVEALD
jgi:hypothetical protein